MGGQTSKQDLLAGEGYRIIEVKIGSPFDGMIEPFFDFIISVNAIPKEPNHPQHTRNALNKLSSADGCLDILRRSEGIQLNVGIVSTKLRISKQVAITPNRNWNGRDDILGVTLRKQRYDEAFDSYISMNEISLNSPVGRAGIKNGQFLIGCIQFPYKSLNDFVQGLYDRYFDREIKEKSVQLAVYDLIEDALHLRTVLLKRGWGGKGLLGCEFQQGILNRFPMDVTAVRQQAQQKQLKNEQSKQARQELSDSIGASRSLVELLKTQKKSSQLKNIRRLLAVQPPIVQPSTVPLMIPTVEDGKLAKRVENLENKVELLQNTLNSIQNYLTRIDDQHDNQEV